MPADAPFAAWIEELAAVGITGGCGGGNYCPTGAVTRQQMSAFLLKELNGAGYVPPPAVGLFGDVPPDSLFAAWIEDLYNRQHHGRLQHEPAALLPGRPEHARADGGVPDEDVLARPVRTLGPSALAPHLRPEVGGERP